jgi:acetyltransferase-like isoleucine patch superfamily enzyme
MERWLRDRIVELATWDRRIGFWRERARQLLVERELEGRLTLEAQARLERGLIWRIGSHGRVRIGEGACIREGTELKVDGLLEIGPRTLIGAWNVLSVLERLSIGADCLLAERVSIRDHDHRFEDLGQPIARQGYRVEAVSLGNNVWIGANVVLMKGVSLGDGCVVGANAVVTRSFGPGTVLVGAPARALRTLEPSASNPQTEIVNG